MKYTNKEPSKPKKHIKITVEPREEVDLRRLARLLLAQVRQQRQESER